MRGGGERWRWQVVVRGAGGRWGFRAGAERWWEVLVRACSGRWWCGLAVGGLVRTGCGERWREVCGLRSVFITCD